MRRGHEAAGVKHKRARITLERAGTIVVEGSDAADPVASLMLSASVGRGKEVGSVK